LGLALRLLNTLKREGQRVRGRGEGRETLREAGGEGRVKRDVTRERREPRGERGGERKGGQTAPGFLTSEGFEVESKRSGVPMRLSEGKWGVLEPDREGSPGITIARSKREPLQGPGGSSAKGGKVKAQNRPNVREPKSTYPKVPA
jgi:hypothetical protein